jgi:C4-dicarboxylate transporter
MKAIFEKVNGFVKGLTGILLGVVGLGVAGQVVLGDKVGLDVIGNLQGIVDGFVGEGASLAGLITLLVVLALIADKSE